MQNSYAQELLSQFNMRFNVDTDDMTLSNWLVKNTKLKGKQFSFDRYPFQRALADETAKNAVTVKPSQVGVSEIYQRVAAAILARNRHRKIIYAYPGDDMRRKNVLTRVKPLIEDTKAFSPPPGQSWVNSIELIEINGSFLYMTGSKASDTVSTDADAIFLDEYDLHDMAQAALFSSRLQNSDWKWARYFSTPTFTQFGVSGLYENSDQHEYMIRCDHCNHWQFPMFDQRFVVIPNLPSDWNDLTELTVDSVEKYGMDLTNSYVACEKCRMKLDLGREDNRAWVAKYPSRVTMRGRKVNPFSVSTRPILDIVAELFVYKASDYIRGFRNSVLGEPEDSSNARIAEALIRNAIKSSSLPDIDREAPTWIGCDMGHTCHRVVLQGPNARQCRSIIVEQVPISQIRNRIKEVCDMYNVVSGMVDRHPESQVAQDIWDITNGIVVPGEYRGDKEMNLIMLPDNKEKVNYVQINRTLHLDQVPSSLKNGGLEFYGYGLLQQELLSQLRNMIRKEEPEKPAEWVKLNPNDHLFHSLAFAFSAMKLRPYIELKVGSSLSMLGFSSANMLGYGANLLNQGSKQWHPKSLY